MCIILTTWQLIRVATVTRTKNTGSYWRDYMYILIILLRQC